MSRATAAEIEQINRLRMERLGVFPAPKMPLPRSHEKPLKPTRQRRRHEPIDRATKQIPDAEGGIGRPYLTRDIVAQMERRGAITRQMRAAADDFRTQFHRAQLDPLKAADVGRIPGGRPPEDSVRIEAARDAVWRKVQSVGGIASPAGSCLWHVIGWESSLKAWALEQGWNGRRVSQEAASGILIAALGALAK